MSERYVGIDLGLRTRHRVAVFDGPNQKGKSFSVAVSKQGFDGLLARATEGVEGPVHFVFEPTGLAWLPLSAYLAQGGHQLYMAKPQKASDLRKFLRRHTKSDQVDAASLARLPQIDPVGVSPMKVPKAEVTSLRRLVRRRDRMTREVGKQKKRIHALLVMVHPCLVDALGSRSFGVTALKFLSRHVDPDKVVKKGQAWLRKFWVKHSRNNAPAERPQKVFEACKRTAELFRDLRKAGALPFDYAAVQEELADEIRWLELTQKEADRLEAKIVELHDQLDPNHTLEHLRGVGPVTSAAIDALAGNVERFRNARCFVSFTGLCPRKRQSGNADPSQPITKAGHRLLKMYLYLAAERARHLDPDIAAYYASRYARGHHHNRIIVALARKMALRVYALLKRRAAATRAGNPDAVSYILRAENGRSLNHTQAQKLIQRRYARAVVAPERDRRDRARRGMTQAPKPAIEWPPEDATGRSSAPPSASQLPRQTKRAKRAKKSAKGVTKRA